MEEAKRTQLMTLVEGMLVGSLARCRPDPEKVLTTILAYEGDTHGDRHVWRYVVAIEGQPPLGGSIDIGKDAVRLTGEDVVSYTQIFQRAIKAITKGEAWKPCYDTVEGQERAHARIQELLKG